MTYNRCSVTIDATRSFDDLLEDVSARAVSPGYDPFISLTVGEANFYLPAGRVMELAESIYKALVRATLDLEMRVLEELKEAWTEEDISNLREPYRPFPKWVKELFELEHGEQPTGTAVPAGHPGFQPAEGEFWEPVTAFIPDEDGVDGEWVNMRDPFLRDQTQEG